MKKIMIIGAGGIGSHLAPILNRTKCYEIEIWDADRVEEKNLLTQNFSHTHIGRFKTDSIAGDRIIGHRFNVRTEKQMHGFDLVVCCADNLAIRRTLYNSGVKWLDLRAQGRNGILISHLVPKDMIAEVMKGPEGSFSCQGTEWDGKAESLNLIHTVVAGLGAQWVHKFFNGEEVKKHFMINF